MAISIAVVPTTLAEAKMHIGSKVIRRPCAVEGSQHALSAQEQAVELGVVEEAMVKSLSDASEQIFLIIRYTSGSVHISCVKGRLR